MKKLANYLKSALYSIGRNKAYAVFCILGTALTFVFVITVLQLARLLVSNDPPQVYADRTVRLDNIFRMTNGNTTGVGNRSINSLLGLVKDYEEVALSHFEAINVSIGKSVVSAKVDFVNSGFWKINRFEFIAGAPFVADNATEGDAVAVVTEEMARKYFRGADPLGQTIELQHTLFRIVGVIRDFSLLSTGTDMGASVFVPMKFNKGIPSGDDTYYSVFLFPESMPVEKMKERVLEGTRFFFEQRNLDVVLTPKNVRTVKEIRINDFGGDLLVYGIGIVVFLLLLIPAVNIVTLSMANTDNQAAELAIRRAMGATKRATFLQTMTVNYLLVLTGALLGLLLAYPFIRIVNGVLHNATFDGGYLLSEGVSAKIILIYLLPLTVVFSLLSGGIPAYLVSKRNISEILKKGGSK